MPNIGFIRKEVNGKLNKWKKIDHCVEGEDLVKSQKERYLPRPETNTDEKKNIEQYEKYL